LETRALLSAAGLPPVLPADGPTATPHLSTVTPDGSPTTAGLTPAQVRGAYGAGAIPSVNGKTIDGVTQTIAIVDAYNDPNILADANIFSNAYSLPTFTATPTAGHPTLTVVNASGGSAAGLRQDAGWATETSLDVEWAHAIAPLANVLLVEATSASDAALMAAVKYAAQHANVVSMSWGGSEFLGQTGSGYDGIFKQYSAAGVTFVASAGDSGAGFGPEWPASSPWVLAVGGTSLTVKATTNGTTTTYSYGGESTWAGGGGGISSIEGTPSYQAKVQADGGRTTPDVAYVGDPHTAVAIFDSIPYLGAQGWYGVGGTSVGAPQWAAIVVLADQARGLQGAGSSLGTGQVANTLYAIAQNAAAYQSNFHDITTGSNGFSAKTGYDLATGLGTPQVNNLVLTLAKTTASSTFTLAQNTFNSWLRLLNSLLSGHAVLGDGSTPAPVNTPTTAAAAAGTPATTPLATQLLNLATAALAQANVPTASPALLTANPLLSASFATLGPGAASIFAGPAVNLAGAQSASAFSGLVFGATGWNGPGISIGFRSSSGSSGTVEQVTENLADLLVQPAGRPAMAPAGGNAAGPDGAEGEEAEVPEAAGADGE
jgi:subtilase family serine protease